VYSYLIIDGIDGIEQNKCHFDRCTLNDFYAKQKIVAALLARINVIINQVIKKQSSQIIHASRVY